MQDASRISASDCLAYCLFRRFSSTELSYSLSNTVVFVVEFWSYLGMKPFYPVAFDSIWMRELSIAVFLFCFVFWFFDNFRYFPNWNEKVLHVLDISYSDSAFWCDCQRVATQFYPVSIIYLLCVIFYQFIYLGLSWLTEGGAKAGPQSSEWNA